MPCTRVCLSYYSVLAMNYFTFFVDSKFFYLVVITHEKLCVSKITVYF